MNFVKKSEELAAWLHSNVDGILVPNHERGRVVAGCFDIVLEHQRAVAILIKYKLYGSAFALARSTHEAYIRGVWLRLCASEKQIQDFLNDKFKQSFDSLVSDIEKLDGYSGGVLSAAKKAGWNLLNSFTHTGFNQVIRRNTDKHIESNYTDEDISAIVKYVNASALLAGLELTFLSENIDLSLEFLEKIEEYAGANLQQANQPDLAT